MAGGYGQYCPLALAAERLCQRWTVLIISRLIDGCSHFNEIHRGVPRISPSLLSRRLAELEYAGIVERKKTANGGGCEYFLTEAGKDLEPIIDTMAVWGQHWARDMTTDDLDPGFLAWSMHRRLDTSAMPPGRTVIAFEFSGAPRDCRRFWLINDHGTVDMCLKPPGFEVDLYVYANLRRFIETWRGFRDLRRELRTGHIRLHGPRPLEKQFPAWLMLSALAPYPRRQGGAEQRLSSAGQRPGNQAGDKTKRQPAP